MLITFTLENWLSFKDSSSFSMVASLEKQHSEHLAYIKKFPLKLIPITAIYGGNASGKSNFIKALQFIKEFIVDGVSPESSIPVHPYKLSPQYLEKPISFSLALLINENIYEYSFSLTSKEVVKEKLTLTNSSREKILFVRERNKITIDKTIKQKNKLIDFVAQTTRSNFLFLTNTVWQNLDTFKNVYDWFKLKLEIVYPESKFIFQNELLDRNTRFAKTVSSMLKKLGTGIDHLEGQEIPLESINIHPDILAKAQGNLQPGKIMVYKDFNNLLYYLYKDKNVIKVKKIIAVHKVNDTYTAFNLSEESDGNLRAIDLIPAFIILSDEDNDKVFIIDEIDRSLHTKLTQRLIEFYLESRSASKRSQLIFTTHDIALMNQDIMRRDEFWMVNRDKDQSSSLESFSDFKEARNDTNIQKSYLEGRMGGLPNIVGNVMFVNGNIINGEQLYL